MRIILISFLLFCCNLFSQVDTSKSKSFIDYAEEKVSPLDKNIEATWDQGIPFLPENAQITALIDQLDLNSILNGEKLDTKSVKLCREIGIAFYNRGLYEAANWYLEKAKGYAEVIEIDVEKDIHYICEHEKGEKEEEISKENIESLKEDINFIQKIPSSLDKISKNDLQKIAKEIESKIKNLIAEKDSLIKAEAAKEIIDSKEQSINALSKEKEIIDLNIVKGELNEEKHGLEVENADLEVQKSSLKKWLITSIISVAILLLGLLVLWQRKTIKVQDAEIEKQLIDINKKNTYLEHAARIIRHDMHSGINTYIPRGLSSLEKRLTPEEIINLKIDGSVKMIKEGLNHTQKVYKSVYEFTNLVKQNIVLEKNECDLEELIKKSIVTTSYANQVTIDKLTTAKVNETLFWNAIDSLIKNGLKYNKNELKWVKIYMEEGNLVVEDNGTGLSEKKFKKILSSKVDNSDEESGLGLNICNAILVEHGFELSCQEIETGTKLKIKL